MSSVIGILITKVMKWLFPDPPNVDFYAKNGKLVLCNEDTNVLREIIVSSVASEDAVDPTSLEQAFGMLEKVPSPGNRIARHGWEILDPDFRLKLSVLEPGEYWIDKPPLEMRRDENCVFEVFFIDSKGKRWIKRHRKRPTPAWVCNGLHTYKSGSIPNSYSEPHKVPQERRIS